jgi:hypothetical protein
VSAGQIEAFERTIDSIVEQLRVRGPKARLPKDVHSLYSTFKVLWRDDPSAKLGELQLKVGLISGLALAYAKDPHWFGAANSFDVRNYRGIPATPQNRRLHALLLTNCAVALAKSGHEPCRVRAANVAADAMTQFGYLSGPKFDRWHALASLVLASVAAEAIKPHAAGIEAQRCHARKALPLLDASRDELKVLARKLVGDGDGLVVTRGLFGRSISHPADFSAQDLYHFND